MRVAGLWGLRPTMRYELDFMNSRFLAACVSLICPALYADEWELGIHYICDLDQQEVRITSQLIPGGSPFHDPYRPFDSQLEALWNYDRATGKFSATKTCRLGPHTITAVFRDGCAPAVEVSSDSPLFRDKNDQPIYQDSPLASSTQFGIGCAESDSPVITGIVIKRPSPDGLLQVEAK